MPMSPNLLQMDEAKRDFISHYWRMKELQRLQAAEKILSSSFRLTPAEARIAYGIARGKTLATIAAAHGIAMTTAKTQLHAVFIKTGTHRQAELTALLAGMNRAFR
jgi:DNA-binding CsgD family transcriptional regulator